MKTMDDSEYKVYHESFMQNNSGSSSGHTFLCILFTVLCTISSAVFRRNTGPSIILEYIIIVFPLILVHTLLAEQIFYLIAFLITIIFAKCWRLHFKIDFREIFQTNNVFKTKTVLTISYLRGLTYLITAFCILAVDFRVFPRYLAKTENYGYSLMDTGVGLFVLMSGLVHKDSINSVNHFFRSNLKLFVILVTLGIARFVSIKYLNYQEHVTEYGVHWNFFFTLAVAKVLSSSLLLIFDEAKQHSLKLGLCVLILHEFMLDLGLEDWVFSNAPRDNFVTANREGLSSCLGYVAMYLLAVHFKRVLCNHSLPRSKVLFQLLYGSLLSWLFTIVVNLIRPASRTLANAGYCCHLLAILLPVLTLFYFVEVTSQAMGKSLHLPTILSAINSNGLLYFLSANLMTGAINLSVRTLFVSNYIAVVVLNVYMIATIFIAVCLEKKGIKL
ncbi:uncharacterized protein At4g17910 [Plutella xylostella]|uniref:uncharacterized protein At4g17910 n=1 Tax=Plutella xylostella TaxID=51655 RepID=UPI0020321F7C|nr:uncharacterized protein At4g17910 [Plutella xylostella]